MTFPPAPRGMALKLLPLLAAFWLIVSGHYTPLVLMLGALSVVLVVVVVVRMAVADEEGLPMRVLPRLPRYLLWLGWQILLSALAVLRMVWSPRRPRPVVATVPAAELPDLSKVIYANSITLTPGTLSVSFRNEDIEVHSIQRAGITDLEGGAMLDRVRGLEGR
ncbi:Na+/H+ antiporter subunit E [Actinomadura sp. 7K507]|uniref:Na+/H+ antiporter subunit E n=1 Tax=Actinomadura sp. 7K507 TaxID=2530365 RepID=UPI0010497DB5|nr:Na+/H+ antiporter subunit E [Actinomadura sp. 7K507]TDC82463.1 cation transporter [Actinomadura sp. 7K507]